MDTGADVIGANCGSLDPSQTAVVISLLRTATSLPLLAQPNAGKPKLIEDKTIFDMSPELFATGISECINAGAKIVGGCCGTTPEHIKTVAGMLKKLKA
jgi:5-methyltetrahydrofolate--homocysteine methyltransferase